MTLTLSRTGCARRRRQIAQDQQALQFGNRVATRFFTRLTARAVREVLLSNPPAPTKAIPGATPA
eukprot:7631587-Pyramimonas_sp.AAC.1